MEHNRVFQSVGIVIIGTLVSRLFGFLREVAIAYRFGATAVTDSYVVALTIPIVIFFAFNRAFQNSFIPVYGSSKHEKGIGSFTGTVTVLVILVLSLVAAVVLLFTPQLIYLVAPGFQLENLNLTVMLVRIMVPGVIFLGLGELASGYLHSHHSFFLPSIATVPFNLCIIATAFFWGESLGINGVAVGTLAGMLLQFIIQLPGLIKYRFPTIVSFNLTHPAVKKMLILFPPIILGSMAMQFKTIIDRIFASFLAEGSISALHFAYRLFQVPHGIFILSMITVLYPSLVDYQKDGNMKAFSGTLNKGLGIMLFLALPMTAGFIVLSGPIVTLLFQRGAFDQAAANATSFALIFYSLGIIGLALEQFLEKGFYALQDAKTPMKVLILMAVVNAGLNALLMPLLGHGGIALATSISTFVGAVVLLLKLSRVVKEFSISDFFKGIWKPLLSTLVMSGFVYFGYLFWESVYPSHNFMSLLLQVGILISFGIILYFLLAFLLRIEEMKLFFEFATKIFRRFRLKHSDL